jgi:hypothetical protein
MANAIAAGACDLAMVDIMKIGGVTGARQTSESAATFTGKDMRILSHLFANNRAWADEITRLQPDFFTRLAHQQAPKYLWIGCSDSRVPANEKGSRRPIRLVYFSFLIPGGLGGGYTLPMSSKILS